LSVVPAEECLRNASSAVSTVIHPDPIATIIVRLAATPWRVVVVGRVGVGKSTLIARWLDEDIACGLGGVTFATTTYRDRDGTEVIDTPGIDAEDAARAELGPLLDDTDVVVWIIDGLTPATASERAIVLGAAASVLHVVISRIDLIDSSERDAVIERVRTVCGDRPASLRAVDVRTADLRELLVPARSTRRVNHALRAVTEAQAAISALPAPPSRDQLLEVARRSWRRAVRDIEDVLHDEVMRGLTDDRDRAVRRLGLLAPHARKRFLDEWPVLFPAIASSLPELPLPEPPPRPNATAWVVSGGQEGAVRALRAAAGSWLMEGDIALADHFSGLELPDPLAGRTRATEALADARRALTADE
jgi:small GTP-binding protein